MRTPAWRRLRSHPSAEDVAHGLGLRDALRELGLDRLAQLGGVPLLLLHVLDPRRRVPALHGPHAPAADAEDLSVAGRGVVAREPRDERGDVLRAPDVELAGL